MDSESPVGRSHWVGAAQSPPCSCPRCPAGGLHEDVKHAEAKLGSARVKSPKRAWQPALEGGAKSVPRKLLQCH